MQLVIVHIILDLTLVYAVYIIIKQICRKGSLCGECQKCEKKKQTSGIDKNYCER